MMRNLTLGTLAWLILGLSVANTASAANLVQYWRLDDGATDATDLSADNSAGGGNPGALTNFALNGTPDDDPGDWITDGLEPTLTHSTGALDFNSAANNYFNAGNIGLTSGTVAMWINQRSATGDDRLFSHHTGGVNQGGSVRIGDTTANGSMQVWTGGTWSNIAPAGSINTGSWQHVAIVYSGGLATAYVDGAAQTPAATNLN